MVHFGIVELNSSTGLPLFCLTKNGSGVPAAPDEAACSFSIYEAGQNTPMSGYSSQALTSLTVPAGFPSAFFGATINPSQAGGFASGQSYGVLFNWLVSSVPYGDDGTFTVA